MNDLCETRCRVVALPHFSTAVHQSDQSTTAFPCQQFCVYLLVVRRCFHLEPYIQMLHCCNKCLTSAISATKQFEGLGSTKFYQSLIVQMEFLRIACVLEDLKWDHTCMWVCHFLPTNGVFVISIV